MTSLFSFIKKPVAQHRQLPLFSPSFPFFLMALSCRRCIVCCSSVFHVCVLRHRCCCSTVQHHTHAQTRVSASLQFSKKMLSCSQEFVAVIHALVFISICLAMKNAKKIQYNHAQNSKNWHSCISRMTLIWITTRLW